MISGKAPFSRKETYWISTSRSLIRKYTRTLVFHGKGYPSSENSGLDIEQFVQELGEGMKKEEQQELKKIMKSELELFKNKRVQHLITEIHEKISFDPLFPKDFDFNLPVGAKLKDDLF